MPDSTTPNPASTIRSERDRYVAFAFAAADLLFEVGGEGRIRYAAGALKSLTGHDAAELIGRPFVERLDESDRALAKVLLASLEDGGRLSPILVKLAAPRPLNVALGGCRPTGPQESSQITITVLPARLAVDERPGARDAKTGLLAKDDFTKLAAEKLRQSGDFRLSLVEVGGLEHLREQADQELSQGFMSAVGRQLRAHSADGDSAGQIADGRFGVVHDGGFDAELFQRQINELARAADIDGVTVEANDIELSAGELSETDAARTLLYAINEFSTAKKGEFTLASLADGFRQLVADTASRVRGLRGAIDAKGFSIVFQPIVSLDRREVHHFEVLSRFAKGGPAEMVNFAEQVGVVAEFDLAVCERAINALYAQPAGGKRAVLAVNISGRSLESEIFASELNVLLRAHADIAPHLMFEITESALITRMHEVQNLVARWRQRGFRVCLDDFGAGSSSFHYLNAFPVDFVKIDGKYVKNALDSPRDRAFLKAMAQLCHDLDTATIAEMIETEPQAALMTELGVGFGQGYLFGKPAPQMSAAPRLTQLSTTMSAKSAAAAAIIPQARRAAFAGQPGALVNWR